MSHDVTFLPTATFDTDDLPGEERFRAWASHNLSSRFSRSEPGFFSARASIWMLNDMVVSEHQTDAFDGVRDEQLVRANPIDHIMLLIPFDGWTCVRGNGIDVTCGPGDVAFLDYGRPFATRNSRQHGAAISLRRRYLEEVLGPVGLHGRIPPSPETDILTKFVRTLVTTLPRTRMSSTPILSRILRDLIATAVGQEGHGGASPQQATTIRQRVISLIAARQPGSFDPEDVRHEAGISRSTMYRLFRADGGVRSYDRLRRLKLVHRALCSFDERPLAAVGFEAGFDDPAYLARLFKRHYGYSMTDLRRNAALPLVHESTNDVVACYRNSISALSA